MSALTKTFLDWGWLILALLAFGFLAFALTAPVPANRWDRATVVRLCRDGTRVFRMEDGEYRVRARSSFQSFHAEGENICR